ncbi:MAG: GerAB/ArcD/ProY family transporter [Bacillota bacterium]
MNKISMAEVVMLAVAVAVATAVLFTPYLAAQTAAQDAWLSVILAGLITIVPAWATASLMARFPNQSIIGVLPQLLGKLLGTLVGLAFAAVFLFSAILAAWRLEVFTARFLLPETPLVAIRILFVLCIAYAALSGSAPLIRTSAYIVPTGMLIIIFVTTLPLRRMDFSYLFPLFEHGPGPMVNAGIMLAGWLCQVPLVIMMFYRHVKKRTTKGLGWHAAIAVLLSAFALELGALGTLAAFGPRQSASMFYPAIEVARIVSIGTFLEHMEVALMAVLIAGLFVAASFYTQAFADSIADIINLHSQKGKVAFLAVCILILIFWPFFFRDLSFLSLITIIRDYGSVSTAIMGGILPLLLLARAAMLPGLKAEAGQNLEQEDGKAGSSPGQNQEN